jgi:hypothetical protein
MARYEFRNLNGHWLTKTFLRKDGLRRFFATLRRFFAAKPLCYKATATQLIRFTVSSRDSCQTKLARRRMDGVHGQVIAESRS